MNRHTPHPYRNSFAALAVSVSLLVNASFVCADELVVARYSTVRAVPTNEQRDPLAALVTTRFPSSVIRVGEAIDALLVPSGYRLARAEATDPGREVLLELPLPEAHRALGPMPLRVALQTLAGQAFTLVEDPVHRLVSLQSCDAATGDQTP